MLKRLSLLSVLLCAACPEQVGSQCPPHTVSIGQYTMTLTGQHPADECRATLPDGGDGGLLVKETVTQGQTFCFGSADGGPSLTLVVPAKGARTTALLEDGGFHFTGHSDPVGGTACGCAVGIDETYDGFLQSGAAGTPLAVRDDGGLPPITGIVGKLTDTLSTDAGADAGCLCTLPCPVIYDITGSRF